MEIVFEIGIHPVEIYSIWQLVKEHALNRLISGNGDFHNSSGILVTGHAKDPPWHVEGMNRYFFVEKPFHLKLTMVEWR